jgi:hypothetical protein
MPLPNRVPGLRQAPAFRPRDTIKIAATKTSGCPAPAKSRCILSQQLAINTAPTAQKGLQNATLAFSQRWTSTVPSHRSVTKQIGAHSQAPSHSKDDSKVLVAAARDPCAQDLQPMPSRSGEFLSAIRKLGKPGAP